MFRDMKNWVTDEGQRNCEVPLIVSRHSATIAWLKRELKSFGFPEPEVVEHATFDVVKDRIVIGNLPMNLAAHCSEYISVILNIPADRRGEELTPDDLSEMGCRMVAFKVEEIGEIIGGHDGLFELE